MRDVPQTVKTMSELTFKILPAAAKTIFITDITEYGAARVATCSCSLSGCWEFWSVWSSGWEQPITWVGSTFVHWSHCFKWSCYFWLLHGLCSFESGRTMPPAHKQDSVPSRIFTESTGSTAPTYKFGLGYRRSFTCLIWSLGNCWKFVQLNCVIFILIFLICHSARIRSPSHRRSLL